MNVEVVDEPVRIGGRMLADAVATAVGDRGRCSLAVSRGTELFGYLASAPVGWEDVELFQVDERAAPDGADERNLTAIERELVAAVDGRKARVHAMPVTGDLDAGAGAYAGNLEQLLGSPPVLDVVHLGIGPDGHTASLVPGDPVLDVIDRWVAVTRLYEGYRRMTLTFPVLNAARRIVIVASGEAKAGAVAALRAGDESIPAARIRAADVTLVIDPAAGGAG